MNTDQVSDELAVNNLQNYMNTYGILSCNLNKYLPAIDEVGGNWNAIITLIEQREVFHCKAYRKRTTYLSKELYYLLKPHKQQTASLPDFSKKILNFLSEYGPANTTTIKNVLFLSNKEFSIHFDLLLQEMLVTVIKKDSTINQTWSSFIWGTYTDWEKTTNCYRDKDDEYLIELLSKSLSSKEITKLMG
ncbi:hypothetical protein HNQ80_000139 [Anaerosolibacter carboniphilus]|uniref:Uncharacterized protein n=1 Tax=Anaerosolibacter carboniphilus TaxID=1417629 RepID=A0A841KPP6_9FIRM|nr:hypothetical protein [Anaerosolibacter carboniphilus]MBB6214070.1 hypothetical protein [Anaerosolibacter carboniphilus]